MAMFFSEFDVMELVDQHTYPHMDDIFCQLYEREIILEMFSPGRSALVLTNKRLLIVHIPKGSGREMEYTTIPYSRIYACTVKDAGHVGSIRLKLAVAGIGELHFDFARNVGAAHLLSIVSAQLT